MPDEELVRLVYKHFGHNARGMLRTVWADGIDIEVPAFALRQFVTELAAAAAARERKA